MSFFLFMHFGTYKIAFYINENWDTTKYILWNIGCFQFYKAFLICKWLPLWYVLHMHIMFIEMRCCKNTGWIICSCGVTYYLSMLQSWVLGSMHFTCSNKNNYFLNFSGDPGNSLAMSATFKHWTSGGEWIIISTDSASA